MTLLEKAPPATRVWVDETYIEYLGPSVSLESYAAQSENVIVCKSMSKVNALSGLRAGYLCAGPHQLEALRAITPPWVISLPAQVAAVEALRDPVYYEAISRDAPAARTLTTGLEALGWEVVPGCANFLLCHLAHPGPGAAEVVAAGQQRGLFLRDAAAMTSRFGGKRHQSCSQRCSNECANAGILRTVLGLNKLDAPNGSGVEKTALIE